MSAKVLCALCMGVHVVGSLNEAEPFAHEMFFCGVYVGFFIYNLSSCLGKCLGLACAIWRFGCFVCRYVFRCIYPVVVGYNYDFLCCFLFYFGRNTVNGTCGTGLSFDVFDGQRGSASYIFLVESCSGNGFTTHWAVFYATLV